MAIAQLGHYSVRTTDLTASRRFYTEVLQMRDGYRPPFDFPGAWLYLGEDEASFGVVHLIGVDPSASENLSRYLGVREAESLSGTGALDHIAFLATDWPALQARCEAGGIDYVERQVPLLGLRQVFLTDPSGVTIELNYPASEAAA